MAFFQKQGNRRTETEYWVYDITSISSYSEILDQVRCGKNKENDDLPQLNLVLLFDEKSNLPFYYRKLPSNIPDLKTVKHLLSEIQLLGYDKVKLVMNRGFYSQENINGLFRDHLKFLINVKTSLKYVREKLEESQEALHSWSNYNEKHGIYAVSHTILWDGDAAKEKRHCYLHLYFNSVKASDDVIQKATKDYEYFALLTNEVKDPIDAFDLYLNKDLVEKAFSNLKERLNLRRTLVSSESSLNGKVFVEFIALIYLSYIKKQMQDH